MANSDEKPDLILVYDRECPVCSAYVRMLRIREDIGELTLVNARDATQILDEISLAGLNMDQGMVLKMNQQLYFGADAIHMLTLISTSSGWFNRLNHWLFGKPIIARFIYPIARFGRNTLLVILGRSKINNLDIR